MSHDARLYIGLDQVTVATTTMDKMTQQNATVVDQSTNASQALAQEADELARLVGRFKIASDTTDVWQNTGVRPRAV